MPHLKPVDESIESSMNLERVHVQISDEINYSHRSGYKLHTKHSNNRNSFKWGEKKLLQTTFLDKIEIFFLMIWKDILQFILTY